MRLLVLVTQEQNASQLPWRPLRIAVDIGEKKTDKPSPKRGERCRKPMEESATYLIFQYSDVRLKKTS